MLEGWLTDRLSSYGLRVGRCGLGALAYLVVGLCLIAAGRASSPVSAAVLIAAATGLTMFTLGAAWGTAIEIGGNHVGVVGGTMNSIGNLVAMLNSLIVAYSVEWFASWDLPLDVMGALFLVGAACWTVIDPRRPVFGAEAQTLEPEVTPAPMTALTQKRHAGNGILTHTFLVDLDADARLVGNS